MNRRSVEFSVRVLWEQHDINRSNDLGRSLHADLLKNASAVEMQNHSTASVPPDDEAITSKFFNFSGHKHGFDKNKLKLKRQTHSISDIE